MRTFLRHMATGHYFRSAEKWTLDREDAHDFGLISKAVKVAHKLRMRELELVLALEGPEEPPAIPFEKFVLGLSHSRKQPIPGKRATRSAALA